MDASSHEPNVSICVLTSGDHATLAKQSLDSILRYTASADRRIIVGANAVGNETRRYLANLVEAGSIDHVVTSETNLGKCPMMRRMFEHLQAEFVWWFDDDSFITSPDALTERLHFARESASNVVMWGDLYLCDSPISFCHDDPVRFVRSATWYRGLPPPFWAPGGKGELHFCGKPGGDGRWFFLTGAGWFARTSALLKLDWPDPRLSTFGEDVFLGEAIRQQGWEIQHIGKAGVELNTAPRRWNAQEDDTLARSRLKRWDSGTGRVI